MAEVSQADFLVTGDKEISLSLGIINLPDCCAGAVAMIEVSIRTLILANKEGSRQSARNSPSPAPALSQPPNPDEGVFP